MKLDLSTAYQQIELKEESWNYVRYMNTHKDVYWYSHLPYDVAATPAIFQGTMDKVLQGLSLGCILDDILLTGPADAAHDENVMKTLARLQEYRLKLSAKKGAFKQASVEYLAFFGDAQGENPPISKKGGGRMYQPQPV